MIFINRIVFIIESLLFAPMVPLLIVDEDRLLIMYDTVTQFFSNVELRKGSKLERGEWITVVTKLMNYISKYLLCSKKIVTSHILLFSCGTEREWRCRPLYKL